MAVTTQHQVSHADHGAVGSCGLGGRAQPVGNQCFGHVGIECGERDVSCGRRAIEAGKAMDQQRGPLRPCADKGNQLFDHRSCWMRLGATRWAGIADRQAQMQRRIYCGRCRRHQMWIDDADQVGRARCRDRLVDPLHRANGYRVRRYRHHARLQRSRPSAGGRLMAAIGRPGNCDDSPWRAWRRRETRFQCEACRACGCLQLKAEKRFRSASCATAAGCGAKHCRRPASSCEMPSGVPKYKSASSTSKPASTVAS